MNSLDTTRREFLEAAAMTGGAFMGGQLMPEVVSPATAQSSTAQDAAMPAQLDVVLRRTTGRLELHERSRRTRGRSGILHRDVAQSQLIEAPVEQVLRFYEHSVW